MSNSEKLDVLCAEVRFLVKNERTNQQIQAHYDKLWRDFALKGSIQTRKAKALQNGGRK